VGYRYDMNVSRVADNLPPHTMLRLDMNVLAIDSWEPSDSFSVLIDGVVFGPFDRFSGPGVTPVGNQCG
jgi:hypothetical protein